MSFADISRRVSHLAIHHSPTILTTFGVIGAFATAVLASKASVEAVDLIRLQEATEYSSEEDRREPREVLKDRAKLVYKLYIPTGVSMAATIACILGANHIGSRRYAGLVAASTIGEKAYEEYKAKVVEKLGEKKEAAVHAEIAQDRADAHPPTDPRFAGLPPGHLCLDLFSNQYFQGSVEQIHAAVNQLNHLMLSDGFASLGDFYRFLEIDSPQYGETVGWNADELLAVRIDSTLVGEAMPCITMSFKREPQSDYTRRFHRN